MSRSSTVYIIAGPTASGKSALALDRAQRLNGVVINADSRQVYTVLPVLTAQPPQEDKESAPHELYGILPPHEECSAGKWRAMAIPLIEEVLQSGRTPIVVGGTGLYIKALTEGLSPMPDVPPEIRAAAGEKQKELGNPGFHAELAGRDPVMAARLDPCNTARLVRAWEVLEATGKSLAEWQALDKSAPPPHWQFEITKVIPDRETLYRNCDARLLKMLEQGALEEIKELEARIEKGIVGKDALVTKTLGYKPLSAFLRGEISREEAVKKAQAETRNYAKRQVTWFRHQLS
ncbi:MAG: tRNA (adenosine(37)-N6)-dimethylallyltransferase MiaA [Alphaproteobacteria bacterium]|nr:tRNA (adenosine(37)-N6)-dimethylallyltransferase MiaA [Alphaproteobacteria bacterium]